MGSEGSIKIHSYFFCPGKISLFSYYDYKTIEIEEPIIGNGYQYEAQEVMNSINLEYIESSIMPQNETLKIMKTLDVIREQWGLVYPQERQLNR